ARPKTCLAPARTSATPLPRPGTPSAFSDAGSWERRKPRKRKGALGRPFSLPDRGFRRSHGSALHRSEELVVGLGALHLVEQELHRADLVHAVQELAQDPDLLQQFRLDQQVL